MAYIKAGEQEEWVMHQGGILHISKELINLISLWLGKFIHYLLIKENITTSCQYLHFSLIYTELSYSLVSVSWVLYRVSKDD